MGPFVLNCQAPDEGNMHTLLHWATDEQKEKYLRPLCEGTAMSLLRHDRARGRRLRPDAHPDARRTRTATSGSSTATSGSSPTPAGRKFAILIARTEDDPDLPQAANSAFIVDIPSARAGTTSATSRRCTAATGHCEILIEDLRVHDAKMLGGRGQGHLLGQYRLGPARLAHCMRWIAQAETALDMMVDRVAQPVLATARCWPRSRASSG